MRKTIISLIIIVIVAVGGFFAYQYLTTGTIMGNNTKHVTLADGSKYDIDKKAVKENRGFARSDEKGKLAPIDDNDPDVVSVSGVVTQWADLTSNRSYETITGDEEYGLYEASLKKTLIEDQDDINQTRMGYINQQTTTKADNIKCTNVVLFPDGHAYARVEYDMTLLHSIDLEAAAEVGFDDVGSTKHDIVEFELIPNENGDWQIASFAVISDWTK